MLILAGIVLLQTQAATPATQGRAPADSQGSARQDAVAAAPVMSLAEAASRFGLTITTKPDTVTVGEHFMVTVRARVPAALQATTQFPMDVDTSSLQTVTTTVDIGQRADAAAGDYVDITQTYELAAWDVGAVPIGLSDLVIGDTRIPLTGRTIFVRSLLPLDSLSRLRAQPKDARDVFHLVVTAKKFLRETTQKYPWIAALVALLVVGLFVWAWLRRRRRAKEDVLIDWTKWAREEFQRIEAMHLLEKGQPELHAILMTNVLRESLVHQFPAVRASATTSELANVLHRESLIPADRALELFERVDMFKFAALNSEVVEARSIGHEDESIVDEIEARRQAEIARLAAEQAAAEAQKKARGAA